jgi:glutamate dehydrogenase/leucine dehydrogenase
VRVGAVRADASRHRHRRSCPSRVTTPSNRADLNSYWRRDEVLQELDDWMADAFRGVHDRVDREQVLLRDAAYFIAVDRVARACREGV